MSVPQSLALASSPGAADCSTSGKLLPYSRCSDAVLATTSGTPACAMAWGFCSPSTHGVLRASVNSAALAQMKLLEQRVAYSHVQGIHTSQVDPTLARKIHENFMHGEIQ